MTFLKVKIYTMNVAVINKKLEKLTFRNKTVAKVRSILVQFKRPAKLIGFNHLALLDKNDIKRLVWSILNIMSLFSSIMFIFQTRAFRKMGNTSTKTSILRLFMKFMKMVVGMTRLITNTKIGGQSLKPVYGGIAMFINTFAYFKVKEFGLNPIATFQKIYDVASNKKNTRKRNILYLKNTQAISAVHVATILGIAANAKGVSRMIENYFIKLEKSFDTVLSFKENTVNAAYTFNTYVVGNFTTRNAIDNAIVSINQHLAGLVFFYITAHYTTIRKILDSKKQTLLITNVS